MAALLQRRGNCRFINVDQAARRLRQPVMMIHGREDGFIPVSVVRALRNSMSGSVRLWAIPHAKHNGSISVAPHAYQRRVARFCRLHLAEISPARPLARSFPLSRRLRPILSRVNAWRSAML